MTTSRRRTRFLDSDDSFEASGRRERQFSRDIGVSSRPANTMRGRNAETSREISYTRNRDYDPFQEAERREARSSRSSDARGYNANEHGRASRTAYRDYSQDNARYASDSPYRNESSLSRQSASRGGYQDERSSRGGYRSERESRDNRAYRSERGYRSERAERPARPERGVRSPLGRESTGRADMRSERIARESRDRFNERPRGAYRSANADSGRGRTVIDARGSRGAEAMLDDYWEEANRIDGLNDGEFDEYAHFDAESSAGRSGRSRRSSRAGGSGRRATAGHSNAGISIPEVNLPRFSIVGILDSIPVPNLEGLSFAGIQLKYIIGAIFLVLVIALGANAYGILAPIKCTVNGTEFSIGGEKNLTQAYASLRESGVAVTPGNLLSVTDQVIGIEGGTPWTATVNGQKQEDANYKLKSGDTVEFTNGTDVMEDYTMVEGSEKEIPYTVTVTGSGSIHWYDGTGKNGREAEIIGSVSGVKTKKELESAQNVVCHYYTPDVGEDKVIALTLDDGPWDDSTQQIIDILKENGAKATFFTVGTCVEQRPELVKQAAENGNQIATHTYDHAEGKGQGVNLGYMSKEQQVDEVTKGFASIDNVLGYEVSRVLRTPGGNFSKETAQYLQPYVTAEINWDLDTEDWTRPGAKSISKVLESAKPGDIILAHDGGGDRSETVEALKNSIPKLIADGYTFITVDELLKYPAKSS